VAGVFRGCLISREQALTDWLGDFLSPQSFSYDFPLDDFE
jgi:hypothetical protein